MCILLFSTSHPEYALIAADNRDEWLERPATQAAWHRFPSVPALDQEARLHPCEGQFPLPSSLGECSTDYVVSGLDASGGGTWFGATASGSFGFLTNVEETPGPLPVRTRGLLAKDWLLQESRPPIGKRGEDRVRDYLARVGVQRAEFAGFNLLIGALELDSYGQRRAVLGYLTNRIPELGKGRHPYPTKAVLDDGGRVLAPASSPYQVSGMSNSTLDDPWRKVLIGENALQKELSCSLEEDEVIARVFRVMATAHPDHVGLADPPPSYYPRPQEARHERHASVCVRPMCTAPPGALEGSGGKRWYATRVSSLLLVPRDPTKEATFVERDVHLGPVPAAGTQPIRVSESEAQRTQRMYRFPVSMA